MCKLQIKMILLENALRASVSVFGSALLCGEGLGEEGRMWSRTLWIRGSPSTSSIQTDGDSSRLVPGARGSLVHRDHSRHRSSQGQAGRGASWVLSHLHLHPEPSRGQKLLWRLSALWTINQFSRMVWSRPSSSGSFSLPPRSGQTTGLCNTQFFQGFLCGWHDRRGKGLASGDTLSVSVHPRRGSILQSQWDD